VALSARGSSDPDGHSITYEWFYYGEPGTLAISNSRTGAPLIIDNSNQVEASFAAPKVTKPETLHIVLVVTDNGTPKLTRYQRVIVTVYP
jgi:hypothetical protein